MSATPKLKNTEFAVREDYSARVRLARKKLYLYAEPTKNQFKIRFDRLHMNKKQFVYNAESDTVIELKA